jgi:hypothetical protein
VPATEVGCAPPELNLRPPQFSNLCSDGGGYWSVVLVTDPMIQNKVGVRKGIFVSVDPSIRAMNDESSRPGRPRAHRRDAVARRLLDAAAQLIDEHLIASAPSIPDALGWLSISKVHRRAGLSRGKIAPRWGANDVFLVDAALWALLYVDRLPAADKLSGSEASPSWGEHFAAQLEGFVGALSSPVDAVISVVDMMQRELFADPRTLLAAHLGPLVASTDEVRERLATAIKADQDFWRSTYRTMLTATGVSLRPEWTVDRLVLALQALIEGFVLRNRIQPTDYAPEKTRSAEGRSLLADSVLALVLSVIDFDKTGASVATSLRQRWQLNEAMSNQ